jgi:adenine-specific DNA-methyltransferase
MPILHWLDRDKHIAAADNVPYRLLEADDAQSAGDPETPNMLIHGDNLEALKALLPYYAGRVKCIYIDPPYNTGKAMEHYDDNLEHSIWLSIIYPRLLLLRELLASDGFICAQIDDSEGPYLKILMDEVFGRKNYIATFFVRVRYAEKTLTQDMAFHKQIEQIHIYRQSNAARPNLPQEEISYEKFNFYMITQSKPSKLLELGGKRVEVFTKDGWVVKEQEASVDGLKEIWASGSILDGNSSGRFFRDYLAGRAKDDGLGALYKVENIGDDGLGYRYFSGPKKSNATKGKYYQGVPVENRQGGSLTKPIENFYDLADRFGNCRLEGGADFRSGKKPEALIQIILKRFSDAGDLVLDSFLGSGTTAAVAHKMGRRYIGIEDQDHALTRCVPRLKSVIEGEQSGISEVVGWKGGGGFRFYKLGSSVFDAEGRVNPQIRFAHLAAHIWFSETHTALRKKANSPFLGVHNHMAFYLLYNGILGDKKASGGNVLTAKTLAQLPKHCGQKIIYGEASRLGAARLKELNIIFKQTPYDVKAR